MHPSPKGTRGRFAHAVGHSVKNPIEDVVLDLPKTGAEKTLEDSELEDIIKEFLNQLSRGLFAEEIQKRIFFADLYTTERYGARLTYADFKPFMYGAYSEDVSIALDNLSTEIKTKHKTKDGQRSLQYFYTGVTPIGESKRSVIRNVSNIIADNEITVEKLRQISKFNWLFKNTKFGKVMDFRQYRNELESGLDPQIVTHLGPTEEEEVPGGLISVSHEYDGADKIE